MFLFRKLQVNVALMGASDQPRRTIFAQQRQILRQRWLLKVEQTPNRRRKGLGGVIRQFSLVDISQLAIKELSPRPFTRLLPRDKARGQP